MPWRALSRRKAAAGGHATPPPTPLRHSVTSAPDVANNHPHRHPHPLDCTDPGELVFGQFSARMLAGPRVRGECVCVYVCMYVCVLVCGVSPKFQCSATCLRPVWVATYARAHPGPELVAPMECAADPSAPPRHHEPGNGGRA